MLDRHEVEYVRLLAEAAAGEPAARRAAQEHGDAAADRMARRQAYRRDQEWIARKMAAKAAREKEQAHE